MLSLSLYIYRGIVCRRSPPHYAPTEPIPPPTAAATTTTTHTHTRACVCVCVWLVAAAKQQAAGESPTRSFGVCTANQTLALTPYLCAASKRAAEQHASSTALLSLSTHPFLARSLSLSNS